MSAWWILASVAAGVLIVLALTVLVSTLLYIGVTYSFWLIDRREKGQLPPSSPSEVQLFVATVWQEFWCVVLALFVHPFASQDPPAPRVRELRPGQRPLLLVHGLTQTRGNFILLGPRLSAMGFGPIYTVNLRPMFGSLERHAQIVSLRIDEIMRATGARQVDVVAHSLGGLATRLAETRTEWKRVRRLVTVGTPHHGTRLSHLILAIPGNDMGRNRTLLEHVPDPPLGAIVSVSSTHDSVVVPPENGRIGDLGRDIVVEHVGHMALLMDAKVAEHIALALAEDVTMKPDLAPLPEVAGAATATVS